MRLTAARSLWRIVLAASAPLLFFSAAPAAFAGPPFLTDDPDPTPLGHYEIFVFAEGQREAHELEGSAGIEINYGAAPDLQLAASLPMEFERRPGGSFSTGLGNIDLAAKMLVVHQERSGLNVAIYPHVTLPSPSNFGDDHSSLFLPVWAGRSGEDWSVFGGGGCAINRGGESQDYCQAGLAMTRSFGPVELGAEVFHQTPDEKEARNSTIFGTGLTYDVSENVHLLSYAGAELEHRAENGRGVGYVSVLFTF